MILHAADFGELLALGHVVVNEAEAAVERHGGGHARFGHGVHVRRDDRDVQLQTVGELGVELGVAGQDFGVQRGEREIVEGETDAGVRGEKSVRRAGRTGNRGSWSALPCRKMKNRRAGLASQKQQHPAQSPTLGPDSFGA